MDIRALTTCVGPDSRLARASDHLAPEISDLARTFRDRDEDRQDEAFHKPAVLNGRPEDRGKGNEQGTAKRAEPVINVQRRILR